MKKIMFLVALLTLVVGVASANTVTVLCGSLGSQPGSGGSTFTGGVAANGPGGTASISGSVGTITCNSFLVPLNYTLNTISLIGSDDASQPTDATSAIQWTWNQTGGSILAPPLTTTVNQESSTGFSFGNCTTINSGDLPCDNTQLYGLTVAGGSSTGVFTFTVSSAAVAGDGVGPTGNTNAQMGIDFEYSFNNPIPEPMSMLLTGGGLLGLGLAASKLRKKA